MSKSSKDFEVKFDEVITNQESTINSQVANSGVTNSQVNNQESQPEESQEYILFDELKTKFEQKIPINEILTIKKYIPIIEKGILVQNIISSAKEINENNMTTINYTNLEIFSKIYVIESFTNYGFNSDTMIAELDYMLEHGIVDKIYNAIDDDNIWSIEEWLYREIDQTKMIDNCIETVVNKHLFMLQDKVDLVISKIPDFKEDTVNKWVTKLSNSIKNFSPDKYSQLQDMMKFAKGDGK